MAGIIWAELGHHFRRGATDSFTSSRHSSLNTRDEVRHKEENRPIKRIKSGISATVAPTSNKNHGCYCLERDDESLAAPAFDREHFAAYPQQPHGGQLVNRVLTGRERDEALARAAHLPMLMVDLEAVITIEMIATGVLSPNEGFMNEADYSSVLESGRLANGLVWPVPLSFAPEGIATAKSCAALKVGRGSTLADEAGQPVAILAVEDIFPYDKETRRRAVSAPTGRIPASTRYIAAWETWRWAAHPGFCAAPTGVLSKSYAGSRKTRGGCFTKKSGFARSRDSSPGPTRFIAAMSTFTKTRSKRSTGSFCSRWWKWRSGSTRATSFASWLIGPCWTRIIRKTGRSFAAAGDVHFRRTARSRPARSDNEELRLHPRSSGGITRASAIFTTSTRATPSSTSLRPKSWASTCGCSMKCSTAPAATAWAR